MAMSVDEADAILSQHGFADTDAGLERELELLELV